MDADVVVIGAGALGLSTALHCAMAGRSVVVVERHTAGSQASGRAAGLFKSVQADELRTRLARRSITRGHGDRARAGHRDTGHRWPGGQRRDREAVDRRAGGEPGRPLRDGPRAGPARPLGGQRVQRLGFSSSLALGEALADWITGETPPPGMTDLAPGRFGPLTDDVLVSRGIWQYAHYYDPVAGSAVSGS